MQYKYPGIFTSSFIEYWDQYCMQYKSPGIFTSSVIEYWDQSCMQYSFFCHAITICITAAVPVLSYMLLNIHFTQPKRGHLRAWGGNTMDRKWQFGFLYIVWTSTRPSGVYIMFSVELYIPYCIEYVYYIWLVSPTD